MSEYRPSKSLLVLKLVLDVLITLALVWFAWWVSGQIHQIPQTIAMLVAAAVGIVIIFWHWLRYRHTFVAVAANTVEYQTGIFNKDGDDIPYGRINNVKMHRSMLGRMLGYGTIMIYSGNDVEAIRFPHIHNPKGLKEEINAHLTER